MCGCTALAFSLTFNEDVGGFEVAVDNSLTVAVLDGIRQRAD